MTTAIWSAESLRQEYSHALSLSEVILAIEKKYWERGEVICKIKVNGMTLDESDEIRLGRATLESLNTLEVQFQKPEHLFFESLETALMYLTKLRNASVEAAEHFQEGSIKEGHQLTLSICECCRWLVDLFILLKNNEVMKIQLRHLQSEWSQVENSWNQIIKNLILAYEKSQPVLLADILEYELSQGIEDWQVLLVKMRQIK